MSDKVIVEYGINTKELEQGQKDIISGNKEIDSSAKQSGKSFNSLVAELKNLKKELATLDEGSAQFKKVAAEAGKVQDKISDISKRVSTLASDTRKLDTVIQAASGIAAGFSIAQGAAGLFGSSAKELEKSLLKVQSAMAILNGLQEIQNLLQKETAIGSKAAAAGQALYSAAVGSSTGALKVFRLALLGTGIGAIVVAVIALAQNFDKVKEVLKTVIPESVQKAFTSLKDSLVGIYDGVKNFVGLGEQVKSNTTIYTAFGGALGGILKPLTDIPKKQKEMAAEFKAQQDYLKKMTDSGAPGSVGRYTFLLNEAKTALDKLVPGSDEYNKQLSVITDTQKDLNEALLNTPEGIDKLLDSLLELNQQEVENNKVAKSLFIETANEKFDIQKDLNKRLIEENKNTADLVSESSIKGAALTEEEVKALHQQQAENTIQLAQQTSDALRGISQIAFNVEKSKLDKQLKDKKISQEKYDKELKEIQSKQAKRDKALNIFNSVISTAAAIVKMLANPGGPAGVALSIAAGITGAIQTALIASQPIPQFAKGIIDLNGKGTETSDSIHAMLSKGESVITADKTRRYKSELTAIHGGNFEQMIYENHVLPAVMKVKVEIQNQLQNMMIKATLDDNRIVKALANNKPNDFNYNRLASMINSGNKHRGW